MLAVYVLNPFTASSVVLFVAAFFLVLVVGVLPKRERIVALVVLALIGVAVGSAYAIPYKGCDPLWHWLGWC